MVAGIEAGSILLQDMQPWKKDGACFSADMHTWRLFAACVLMHASPALNTASILH